MLINDSSSNWTFSHVDCSESYQKLKVKSTLYRTFACTGRQLFHGKILFSLKALARKPSHSLDWLEQKLGAHPRSGKSGTTKKHWIFRTTRKR